MNKKNIIISIAIMLFVGLAVLAGYFYYTNIQSANQLIFNQNTNQDNSSENKNINSNTSLNMNLAPAEPNKEEGIDTSDWKTYKNEECGLEFKYPEKFKVDYNKNLNLIAIDPGFPKGITLYGDERDMSTYDLKPQFSITMANTKEKIIDLEKWLTINYPSDYIKRYVKIGNYIFLNLEPSAMVDSEEYILYKNNIIYEFYLSAFPTNTNDEDYNKSVNYGFMEIINSLIVK